MTTFKAENGEQITLQTKDTDMLIISFEDKSGVKFAEIRTRGAESDAVIKKIKNRA